MATDRPAFYALAPGGWRDLVTVLHPPYTLWHLSYVALGAAAAPHVHGDRLSPRSAAFFLAVGVSAHALDELHGRPLGPAAGAAPRGHGRGRPGRRAGDRGDRVVTVSVTLLPLVVAGGCAVLAYNLELFEGRFHTDFWFAAPGGRSRR
jgi:hypothetical protein